MNKSRLRGAVCACLVVASFNASSALLSRAGGAAYYDTDSNLTWLADADLAYTNSFGITVIDDMSQFGPTGSGAPVNSDTGDITGFAIFRDIAGTGINYRGAMSFDTANEFTNRMNADNGGLGYLGTNTWRLPSALNSDSSGPCESGVCPDSEFGSLYFNALGGLVNPPLADLAPFSMIYNAGHFWTSTPYTGPDNPGFTGDQWFFSIGPSAFPCSGCLFNSASTDNNVTPLNSILSVWAVATGDVLASTVPVPAAVWLFGSGLLGLIGIARRKKTA